MAIYNNEEGSPDSWRRDGKSASAAFTHVFSGGDLGSHTFETGVQFVRSTMSGGISVSPTGYSMDAIPTGATPFADYDSQTGELRYNMGGDEIFNLRWQNIPVSGLEADVDNYALYVQDAWELGPWRLDLGLRWERYEISAYRKDLEQTADGLAPRLGVTRSISPRVQAQATWGRYYAKLQDRLLSLTGRIFDYSLVERFYTGPELTGLTAEEIELILRDDTQWDLVTNILDPNQPTTFLASDIDLPYTDELTLGVRAGLPRNSGSLTVTYIDRDYEDLPDDLVGGYGSQSIVDPFDPVNGQTTVIDNVIWDNASRAKRQYRAIVVTGDYRPGVRWDVGGNWTLSELTGNQDIPWRQVINGTAIGTYERSRPERSAVPDGDLLDDVRLRIQAWGNYRWDLDRLGLLTLGVVGRYETGRNWSRVAWLPLSEDPEYNNEVGQLYMHYFDGRGDNRFDDWWTLDVATRWQFRVQKRLDAWVKVTVLNVLDNDDLIAYDTSGYTIDDGMGNPVWAPAGNCGPGDPPSVDCTGFGAIRSQNDYQLPRSYLFTLGLSF
jgi:hypothetical protein